MDACRLHNELVVVLLKNDYYIAFALKPYALLGAVGLNAAQKGFPLLQTSRLQARHI